MSEHLSTIRDAVSVGRFEPKSRQCSGKLGQIETELVDTDSNIRIEDRPCQCQDSEGFACFQCDDYARSLAKAVRPETCTCTELNGEDYVCIECHEHAQALKFAKSRNQVDADGNVRIGIADFQPRFLVTDDTK